MSNQEPIQALLACKTPLAWFEQAPNHLEFLLIDHAHCERKAAQYALRMINNYPNRAELVNVASRIAREELVHFERVLKHIKANGYQFRSLSASNYAAGLLDCLVDEPETRLIQKLIIAAFIEARSCERFLGLEPYMEGEVRDFYLRLAESEKRHFEVYLKLAEHYSSRAIVEDWVIKIRQCENRLILTPSRTFRFHSGPVN